MGGEFKKALACAAAFIGAVVGAGMASGAEILIYFTSMGKFALAAIILAVILICLIYSLIASYAAKRSEGDIKNLCLYLFPRAGGVLYGGIAGYLGGKIDMIMMRIVDIISTIPLTLYVILIMQVLGAGIQSIIVALGSVYWVDMARVVRGQILSLKQQEFVLAAKTIGSSATTILFDHLIPNALGSILVTITMLIPSAIFMEAFLGYLGIGLQPPLASLGTMCNDASANLRTSPHELLIPALMICVIMFAFNFVGDGLRDALDPKLKK